MPDHYFTADPASPDERVERTVRLAGREVVVETAPGIFSPGGLDKATAILLEEAPDPVPTGAILDLGCGWGPIALSLALRSPDAHVVAVDVNARSVDLTHRNAARLGLDSVVACAPGDVDPELRFEEIWSNPPIRIGKAALHELLLSWLPRLTPMGQAWLVVGKNLGADSLQRWITEELALPTERVASSKGFRILRVTR